MVGYLVEDGYWVCHGPEEENGTWLNETLKENCSFQYWKANGIVFIILSLCIIPANCYAIYKFYLRNVNKMFFILTTSLCICNFSMSAHGLYTGVVNILHMQGYTISYSGCGFYLMGSTATTICTMVIQAIISYERRKAITSTTFLRVNYWTYIFLALTVAYSITVTVVFFIPAGVMSYEQARVDRNTSEMTWVCTGTNIVFTGFIEAFWGVLVFVIPLAFIIYNYK